MRRIYALRIIGKLTQITVRGVGVELVVGWMLLAVSPGLFESGQADRHDGVA